MGLDPDQLRPIASAYRLSQLVYACASLKIADALAAGAGTVDAVAGAIGAPASTVARLLRAAASEGIIEASDGRYALNSFSRQLSSHGPESMRDFILGWSLFRPGYVAFSRLDEAVRTGRSGTELVFGQPFHRYLRAHPDEAALYGAAMESTVDGFRAAADAYDFTRFSQIVDVGAGQGSFLVAILQRHVGPTGVLFDLPDVVAGVAARLAPHPEAERISIQGGDMFDSLPTGADCYLMSTVLRCFGDDACRHVLRNCRDAMRPKGRVLALEMVMPEGIPPSPRGLADLQALTVYGGADRTETEWTALLTEAGFAAPAFHPIDGIYTFIDATVA